MDYLRLNYGVGTTRDLLHAGMSTASIERAVSRGDLTRLRRGWFALPTAHPTVAEAVAAGGVLSCASALAVHEVWVPPLVKKLHIRAGPYGIRGDVRGRFCRPFGRPEPECGPVDDVRTAFRHCLRCLDDESIIVVADSILYKEKLTEEELYAELAAAPQRIQELGRKIDGRAQSGTETMARLRLRRQKVRVEPQAKIPGVGAVDLLIGTCLILEFDSVLHHTGTENYANDRVRDRESARRGYITMRFT